MNKTEDTQLEALLRFFDLVEGYELGLAEFAAKELKSNELEVEAMQKSIDADDEKSALASKLIAKHEENVKMMQTVIEIFESRDSSYLEQDRIDREEILEIKAVARRRAESAAATKAEEARKSDCEKYLTGQKKQMLEQFTPEEVKQAMTEVRKQFKAVAYRVDLPRDHDGSILTRKPLGR